MKFSCTQENLSQALQIVSHITVKNNSLPILNNVLLKIENKELQLITTNLEMAINCKVRAKIEEDGEYTVPANLFNEYLSVASLGKVDVESKENGLVVNTVDGDKTLIKGAVATEFPLVPVVEKENIFGVLIEDFKKISQQVLFAVSRNEARPELCGVLFNFNPENKAGYVVCASTDSYRLAEKEIKMVVNEKYGKENKKIIIPAKALQEVLRVVSVFHEDLEENPPVEMVVADNQIMFSYGPVEITSRLVEGQYPDYRQIIPTNFKTTVEFSVSEWIKRIKAASIFSNTGINGVAVKVFAGNDQRVSFSSMNSQLGEHTGEVLGKIDGENNEMLLNYRYLLDGLSALGAEEGLLKIITPDSPCVLMPKGKEGYLYIIMPIRQ
ncbi:MAG: polymerase III subunit beta protein [Candidatus Magasanikbacteria bacterium GW2011_GWC2_40_17]|uniref:Beta sliding clamp n=1 Tax=Candidatus Magasanikbacteria bacterium GW2011_GWA2_42_32 TaxID=1619039 RepID=A0A0G1A7Q1_9BACT|nr:MAG: polymerase III subunit beta protein [Candidatus Magasanikbacteria bacterium GW2011_GWC2_40_17]KKS57075.1 MAG: polymerase III subunit beta protein [Candidatus Magasanikbacteria bacterium GW2011_GWA2_42_32]OGH85398.1 MAG: DNA polymerase III subunit beta [Candidatus Magasanikbacteria bacterium RIFOXYB2_FULL_38_10]